MEITIRPFNKENDSGFIFSTLPKGIFHASVYPTPDRVEFFTTYYNYLKDLIDTPDNADIVIATSSDDPTFIIGYAILKNKTLEFIYVKYNYRRHGIASLMLSNTEINDINPKNLTIVGLEILKKHPNLFKKELLDYEPNSQITH